MRLTLVTCGSLVVLFTLLYSAVVQAETPPKSCLEKAEACTPIELCAAATSADGSAFVWSDEPTRVKHVSLAKSFGMNCGTLRSLQACTTDPKKCSVVQLCEVAIASNVAGKVWREDRKAHKDLIEKFGIDCGFKDLGPAQLTSSGKCSNEIPENCADELLCEMATYLGSGFPTTKRLWKIGSAYRVTVSEAKKRGLLCGVGETVSVPTLVNTPTAGSCTVNSPQKCTDQVLCGLAVQRGIKPQGTDKVWRQDGSYTKVVQEALRRNLDCGITASVVSNSSAIRPKARSSDKNCSLENPERCHDKELCVLATERSAGRQEVVSWRRSQSRTKAVLEAKARNLACGVNNSFAQRLSKYTVFTHQTGEFKSQVSVGVVDISGRWNGERFYWWPNGSAKYFHGWHQNMEIRSDATFETVYPLLKEAFEALKVNDRKRLQSHLARKGLYSETIDGAWGKNTLLSLVSYSALRLRTVNLNSQMTVTTLFEELAADTSVGKVVSASDVSLRRANRYIANDKKPITTIPVSELKVSFESLNLTLRMQIQYGLKVLGYYKSSVDGQWGSNTSAALIAFRTSSSLQAFSLTRTAAILKKLVDVPDSFTIKRQRTKSQREVKDTELFGTSTNNQQSAAPSRVKTKRSGEVLFGLPD